MAGLPYVPLHVVFPRGKEAVALRIVLQKPKAWAYVAEMWTGVAQHAPDGRVEGPAAVAQLEEWAGWDGAPGAFVEALCLPHVGLLDHTDRGFYVHNWHVHCGAHIEKRQKDRERKRQDRAAKKSADRPRKIHGRKPDVPRKSTDECEGKGELEQKILIRKERVTTPLVSFLAETYPDIRDPWACEASWTKAYPRVDLLAEAIKARAWETSNPQRAKKNHAAFLNRWFSNATPVPPKRTHGDLGVELRPWQSRLTREEKQQAHAELAALHPDLADAPLGCTGDPRTHPIEAIADLNAKWRAVAEGRS